MAIRGWPARTLSGNRFPVVEYTLKSGEAFKRGDFVALDANEDVLEVSGADPASLLGMAAEDAAGVVRSGRVLVHVATGDVVFAMQGTSAPTEDDVNQSYGIVETNGIYLVDVTDTSNLRFYVVDVDVDRELFFVIVLDAARVIKA